MELVNGKLYETVKVYSSNKRLNEEDNSNKSSFKHIMNENKLMD